MTIAILTITSLTRPVKSPVNAHLLFAFCKGTVKSAGVKAAGVMIAAVMSAVWLRA
jgi:hypothetical protein